MAERKFHDSKTQGVKHVDYCFMLIGAGAAPPTLGEGDSAGSYIVNITRTGTGVYTFTTKDPFVAVVGIGFQHLGAGALAQWNVDVAPLPVQNAAPVTGTPNPNTFTFTINFFVAAVATDLVAGTMLSVWIRFRNSLTKP